MSEELFQRRQAPWVSEDDLSAFNLACVAKATDTMQRRQEENICDGNPVQFEAEEETVWDVVATSNQALHDKVIAAIAECRRKTGT